MAGNNSLPRPLYSFKSNVLNACPPSAHTGLWYDKFCHCWKGDERPTWTNPIVQKADWIDLVVDRSPIGDAAVLNEFGKRQETLVKAMLGKCLHLKTESRFVTGLGREHPVENGLTWHATLGTPFLPGSSVKGLVRAWGAEWGKTAEGLFTEVFGSDVNDKSQSEQVGSIIFFDAVPLEPIKLEMDVMTPHYSKYYQNQDPPGDWISPTPIPFLVIAQGTRFQFSFAPRTNSAIAHIELVETWLREALQWLGAGAKTATGYGRFGIGKQDRNEPANKSVVTNRPRYEKGDLVNVTRIEDPKPKGGKSRIWFVADDGFGGVVTGGTPPDIAIGEVIQLEIAAVMSHGGYNFRLPKGGS